MFQSSPDRGDVGLSFGGCCHVGWDGVEPDTSASVPHQIPQIADGRVRPEHIGYNAAITALLTIDWKEPPQVSETDYRQEIFDFLKEVQISFTQKEQIYRLVEKYGKNPLIIQELSALDLGREVYEVVSVLLWAYGANGM